MASARRDPSARSQVRFPPGGTDNQHVRGAGFRLPGLRVVVRGEHVDRGLVGAQRWLGGQCGLHRVVEPGVLERPVQPGAGLVHEPGRDRHAQQHGDQVRGPLGGHVPVCRKQHRGRVDRRPVGDGARVHPGRRGGRGDLPAARALQHGQQPLRHEPADLHVPDLRPRRARAVRAVQGSPAPRALRRRIRALALTGAGVPGQARARMPGLPAPRAVLAPLPLRGLPVPPLGVAALPRPDRLLGGRHAGVAAVHAQPALQLRHPQHQPPLPVQRRRQLGAQHGVLSVPGLDHGPQPGQQPTLLSSPARQIRLIGHKTKPAQPEVQLQAARRVTQQPGREQPLGSRALAR